MRTITGERKEKEYQRVEWLIKNPHILSKYKDKIDDLNREDKRRIVYLMKKEGLFAETTHMGDVNLYPVFKYALMFERLLKQCLTK